MKRVPVSRVEAKDVFVVVKDAKTHNICQGQLLLAIVLAMIFFGECILSKGL